MSNTYEIYLVSDSTGETLERIFLAIKAQFKNFNYKTHYFSFTRTENQILKIIENSTKNKNSIFLYTIVDNKLAQFLSTECNKKKIPCFGVLGDLIFLNSGKYLPACLINHIQLTFDFLFIQFCKTVIIID